MPSLEGCLELVEGVARHFHKGELEDETVQGLYRCGKFKIDVRPFDEFFYTVTSKDIVGHVPIGRDLLVRIQPKTPVSNLFRMLEVAYDLKSFNLLPGVTQIEEFEDLYERIAKILASRILARARKGIFRDYIAKYEALGCVRGRLDVRRTAVAIVSGVPSVHCEYQEHTPDLEDNQILLWTLWILSGMSIGRADVRSGIRAAYRALAHTVTLVPISPAQCANRRYHRLNEDYELLHGICRLLLEHSGPGSGRGDYSMIPFTVDMPDLFERFVALWLQGNLGDQHKVEIQHHAPLESSEKLSFRIDIVIQDPESGKPIAVMDTKYKVGETPVEADVQQVVAYAVRMGVSRAFLVYPSSQGANLKVRVGGISIEGLAFDLGADYDKEGQRFRESLISKLAA